MKILIATGLFPPEIGGPATYSKFLADELPTHGIDVDVLPFSTVRTWPVGVRHILYFFKVLSRAHSADIVYAQDPVSVGLPASLAARIAGKPLFLKVVGDYAWEQARQRFGVHDSLDVFQYRRYGWHVEFMRAVERFVARRAERIIVPSDYLRRVVSGWSKTPIVRIYNGIDFDIEPMKITARPEGKLIVTSARLVPWKGIKELIDTVALEREWTLAIVGDGPDRAKLENHAKHTGAEERVMFLGTLPRTQALGWYAAADVFVLNSSYEGLSHALVEAMSQGTPCVATRVGGNAEVVTHGVNGLLVPHGDARALHEALARILSDHALAGDYGAAAQKRAQDFTIERTLTQTTELVTAYPHDQKQAFVRVLMVSGDPLALDEHSAVHGRLLLQSERVGWLEVLVPARRAGEVTLAERGVVRGFAGSKLAVARAMMRAARGRHFDIVTAQDPFLLGFIAWRIARGAGARLQLQLHTNVLSHTYASASLFAWMRMVLAGFLLKRADCVRAVSERIKQSLEEAGIAAPVSVLPIFIDRQAIESAPVADLKTHYQKFSHHLLVAARLEKEKHIDDIIRAMPDVLAAHPHAGLFIAGEGRERTALKELACNLGVDTHVVFLGRRSDVFSLYKAADVVIAATAPYEGYGATTVEALAAGVPVISEDVGVAREAGAVIAPRERLAQIIIETIGKHDRGTLRLTLPSAETWASGWQQGIEMCDNR